MEDPSKKTSFFDNLDKVISVGIADIKYATPPAHLRTNLGSCVALILYDNIKKIGGLVHVMLPKSLERDSKVGKYANTAVPEIINNMINQKGCDKKNLVAKIFGGAKILTPSSIDIGRENTEEVVKLTKEHNIRIHAMKTGGTKGYVVQLDTSTGAVMCKVFGEEVEYF